MVTTNREECVTEQVLPCSATSLGARSFVHAGWVHFDFENQSSLTMPTGHHCTVGSAAILETL